jgi:hypothetical protein
MIGNWLTAKAVKRNFYSVNWVEDFKPAAFVIEKDSQV